MRTQPIEILPRRSSADQDREMLVAYQGGSLISAVAALGGLYMTSQESLDPRQRTYARIAGVGTAGLGVLALTTPVQLAKLLRRRVNPWTLPTLGLLAVAKSGGNRSPMFFPAVTLSALGGGRLGAFRWPRQTASGIMGLLLGGAYAFIAIGSKRPWHSGWDMALLWNLGVAPTFAVSPMIGGEIGELALSIRRLERARDRDRDALLSLAGESRADSGFRGRLRAALGKRSVKQPPAEGGLLTLRELADRTRALTGQLEEALLAIASVPRPSAAQREIAEAVAKIREGIEHHLLAPTLVSAARNEPVDLVAALNEVLDVYRNGWKALGIELTLESNVAEGRMTNARVVSVLIRALKVGVDNAFEHRTRDLRSIHCRLTVIGKEVTLRICDDGGGDNVPRSAWGKSLSETEAQVKALGGDLDLLAADGGLELSVQVPSSPLEGPLLDGGTPVSDRADRAFDHCFSLLVPSNAFAGVMGCLTAGRSGAKHAAAFIALAAIDRIWHDRRPGDQLRPALVLPAVASLWPQGGVPAGGWIGAELFFQSFRRRRTDAIALTAVTAATLVASGLRVRGTIDRGRFVENVAFSPFCSLAALAPRYLRSRLIRAEHEALSLRERAELIETLARAARLDHDVTKPLRSSGAWYGGGIKNSEAGQKLLRLSGDLDDLVHELLARIAVADPIQELQHHLQMRLDPVAVLVAGHRPVGLARPTEQAVQTAREHLALVALADNLADWLLRRFPPGLNGRSALREVTIAVSPVDEEKVRVALRPHPSGTPFERDVSGLVSALVPLDGEMEEGFEDGGMTFTVSASILSAP
jgi:hypothetical protein